MVNVKIPALLSRFTNHQREVQIEGNTVIEVVENLEKNYPGIKKRLLDEAGKIRKFIDVYVDGEDIRFLQKEATEIKGKEITIVSAVTGG